MFSDNPSEADGSEVLRPVDAGEQGPVSQTDDDNRSEIREAIDRGARVMVASIPLPTNGPLSEADKRAVRENTERIRRQFKVKYSEMARQLGSGCSDSAISMVLNGKYPSPDDTLLRRVNAWCESYVRRQESIRTEGIATTGVVLAVRALAEYGKAQGCIVVGFGPAGIGKTEAAKVAATEDPSSAYIRLRDTHLSPAAFLRLVASAVHQSTEGGASRLCDAIVDKLKNSHRLIVCDEWHKADRRIHEVVRDLHDETGCPFLLLGTKEIYTRLQKTRSSRGEAIYDQFFSRVGWCLDLAKLAADKGGSRPLFTEAEIRQIFNSGKVRITRDGIQFLQALACSFGLGCLRTARRVFEMACRVARQKNVPVDRMMLHKALIEQAVPHGADAALVERMVEDSAASIVALAG